MQFFKTYLIKFVSLLIFLNPFKANGKAFLREKIDQIDNDITYLSEFKNGIPKRILEFKNFLANVSFDENNNIRKNLLKSESNQMLFENPINFNIESYKVYGINVYFPPLHSLDNIGKDVLEISISNSDQDEDDKELVLSLYFRKNSSVTQSHPLLDSLKTIYEGKISVLNTCDKDIYSSIKDGLMRFTNLDTKVKWIGAIFPLDVTSDIFDKMVRFSKINKVNKSILITSLNSTLIYVSPTSKDEDNIMKINQDNSVSRLIAKFNQLNQPNINKKFLSLPRFQQIVNEKTFHKEEIKKATLLEQELYRKCRILGLFDEKEIKDRKLKKLFKICKEKILFKEETKRGRRQNEISLDFFDESSFNSSNSSNLTNSSQLNEIAESLNNNNISNLINFDQIDDSFSNSTLIVTNSTISTNPAKSTNNTKNSFPNNSSPSYSFNYSTNNIQPKNISNSSINANSNKTIPLLEVINNTANILNNSIQNKIVNITLSNKTINNVSFLNSTGDSNIIKEINSNSSFSFITNVNNNLTHQLNTSVYNQSNNTNSYHSFTNTSISNSSILTNNTFNSNYSTFPIMTNKNDCSNHTLKHNNKPSVLNNTTDNVGSVKNLNVNFTIPKIYKYDKVTVTNGVYVLDSTLIIGKN